MMGTLRRQLEEQRMPDALPAVLAEIARVRAELGYPIMVTPYSQFVGSQAMLNVVGARAGQARWSRLPDEVIRYVLGHFGTPPGEIAEVVRDAVAASPRTRELDRPPAEPTIDEIRAQVASSLGRPVDDDEAVLRMVLPGDQLDAVERAGPAPAWVDPGDASARPAATMTAADFVRAVQAIPGWRRLDVTLGDEHVSLRREAAP
jgi:oxaloacetate decarboxylase alpha subunit